MSPFRFSPAPAVFLLSTLLLSSCGPPLHQVWLKRPEIDLVRNYGVPDKQVEAGGSKFFEYSECYETVETRRVRKDVTGPDGKTSQKTVEIEYPTTRCYSHIFEIKGGVIVSVDGHTQ